MKRIAQHRPSPAMVVACLALSIAVGGTSYAAVSLPMNSVGPKQIKRNAVTGAKVKNRSLRAADFAQGQLPAGPRGPQGAPGAAGAAGANGKDGANGRNGGVVGTIVVRRTDIALTAAPPTAPGGWVSEFAECGTGEKIMGGSVNVSSGTDAEVNISRPALDAGGVPDDGEEFTKWKGTARQYPGQSGDTMRVFAICVQQP